MTHDSETTRAAQDSFHSMVGGTEPYPDDPQHPDPGFEVSMPQDEPSTEACSLQEMG